VRIHWKTGKKIEGPDGIKNVDEIFDGDVLNAVVKDRNTLLVTRGTDLKWYEVPLDRVIVQ